MKHNYDELLNNFNRIQEELKKNEKRINTNKNKIMSYKKELTQTKEELTQTKEELTQTKEELTQTKEELTQTKEELKQTKEELDGRNIKQYSHTIIVGGYDKYNQLGEKPNKKYDYTFINPSLKSLINPYSLLSFSVYDHHSIEITRSGKILGIGYNSDGRICDSLPKKEITEFSEFSIRDVNDSQLDPISAVCCLYGTLYMFSSGSRRQLVLCDRDINAFFLFYNAYNKNYFFYLKHKTKYFEVRTF